MLKKEYFSVFLIFFKKDFILLLTDWFSCVIISSALGYSQAVRHQTLTLAFRWFEPSYPSQKILVLRNEDVFIQAAGLVYHRRAKCGAYHQGRKAALVSHHAPACILLRLYDIQCFALMICNSFGIDDIHAFGVRTNLKNMPERWSTARILSFWIKSTWIKSTNLTARMKDLWNFTKSGGSTFFS